MNVLNDEADLSYRLVSSEALTFALYLSKIAQRKATPHQIKEINSFCDELRNLLKTDESSKSSERSIVSSPQGLELVLVTVRDTYGELTDGTLNQLNDDFSAVKNGLDKSNISDEVVKKALFLKNFFGSMYNCAQSILQGYDLEKKLDVSGLLS